MIPRMIAAVALLLSTLQGPLGGGADALGPPVGALRYDIHAPIRIVGDADFASPLSGVRSGSGTPDDPFVIARWTIPPTDAWGIILQGTNAHVIIEDVDVVPPGAAGFPMLVARCETEDRCFRTAVQVEDAANVTLRHVLLSAGNSGAVILRSSSVRMEGSTIGGARTDPLGNAVVDWGVEVAWSRDVTLSHLEIRGTVNPILVWGSERVLVERSVMRDSDCCAEVFSPSSDVRFVGNDLDNTALVLSGGPLTPVEIVDNSFTASREQPHVYIQPGVEGPLVCGNRFEVHQGLGVVLRDVRDARILGNRFLVEQGTAVDAWGGSGLTVSRNVFRGATSTWNMVDARSSSVEAHENDFDASAPPIALGPDSNATLNWWGHPSGPSGAAGGQGAYLLGLGPNITYEPWLDVPPEVPSGCSE